MIYYKKKKSNFPHYIRLSILLLIIIISSFSQRANTFTSKVGNVIMAPFTELTNFVLKSSNSLIDFAFGTKANREIVNRLTMENQQLREEVNSLKLVVDNSEHLKSFKLLEETSNGITANISTIDPQNLYSKFTINKGSLAGVKIGDVVVTNFTDNDQSVKGALVGKIVEVGPNYSLVSTIFDEAFNLSFIHSDSMITGIINDRTDNNLNGYLLKKEVLKKGDKIYTSGTGGRYKRGLYIGSVIESSESPDRIRQLVKIDSPVDISKLYDVIVIKGEE